MATIAQLLSGVLAQLSRTNGRPGETFEPPVSEQWLEEVLRWAAAEASAESRDVVESDDDAFIEEELAETAAWIAGRHGIEAAEDWLAEIIDDGGSW